ncbi:hypothetical protein OOT46_15460 [Aquabacterium sp. A7-Y]|uniref:hypothetical protein n=1 Tax=Aquabacterium sp. A7-Y TaxID=1349605 RepID=UPI00223D05D7|nr:hypothetical protein [Aquabacterium sp. A7-Y]MCW7539241.1 hypothetical protein [Aquabacterium sp. A7-Y]
MHLNQVRERFEQIELCIDDAALACRSSGYAPQELKEYVGELDRRSDQLKRVMQQAQDASGLLECLESLEQVGERVMEACRNARHVDPQLRSAIQEAHLEITALKRALH